MKGTPSRIKVPVFGSTLIWVVSGTCLTHVNTSIYAAPLFGKRLYNIFDKNFAYKGSHLKSAREYRQASEFDEMLPEAQAASELQAWLAHREMGNPEESPVLWEHGTSA
jgi:hypothetical protein